MIGAASPAGAACAHVEGELVARGGMAEVYLGRVRDAAGVSRTAALKRLRPELARDPQRVARFRDEARIGALFRHPNVVEVLDTEDGDETVIAMEYVPGEELSALCRRGAARGRLPGPWEAAEIGRQAAEGLSHVHGRADDDGPLGVVHGDLSPPNLLVTARGEVVVIDFGVARARIATAPPERVAGKLAYMAPEQAAGLAIDERADVFSLGVILWELVAGERLFRGRADDVRARLLRGDIPPLGSVAPGCPAALAEAVTAALCPEPARRPSARELADMLLAAGEGDGVPAGPQIVADYVDRLGPSVAMRRIDAGPRLSPGVAARAAGDPRVAGEGPEFQPSGRAGEAPSAARGMARDLEVPPWLLVAGGAAAASALIGLLALWQL